MGTAVNLFSLKNYYKIVVPYGSAAADRHIMYELAVIQYDRRSFRFFENFTGDRLCVLGAVLHNVVVIGNLYGKIARRTEHIRISCIGLNKSALNTAFKEHGKRHALKYSQITTDYSCKRYAQCVQHNGYAC